jgi:hypothetical protein
MIYVNDYCFDDSRYEELIVKLKGAKVIIRRFSETEGFDVSHERYLGRIGVLDTYDALSRNFEVLLDTGVEGEKLIVLLPVSFVFRFFGDLVGAYGIKLGEVDCVVDDRKVFEVSDVGLSGSNILVTGTEGVVSRTYKYYREFKIS